MQFRKTAINVCKEHKEHHKVLNKLLEHSISVEHYEMSGKQLSYLDKAVIFAGKRLGFPTERNKCS